MVDYREILRLSSDTTLSQRSISILVRCSHHTVKAVQTAAKLAGISWPLDDMMTNLVLRAKLFPQTAKQTVKYALPAFEEIHRELGKPGVTLSLLWNEYCRDCTEHDEVPYMYSQFCEKYRQWARATKATMRIQHKPGDAMEVDWAGNTLEIHDPVNGEISKAYLFVAVLPCSCYTYVELCGNMKLENWLMCHVHAYSYFGGTTRLLIPDNLKTGVKSNTRYETVLNRSYQEMASYYDTAIVPARVEHPRDKSHVEGTVKVASTWILAALRSRRFFSVEEANEAVAEKLEELNERPFKNHPGSRRRAFLEEEQEYLRPLPTKPYEPAIWSPDLLVGYDYLVSDGINKYSVPFDLIGHKVNLRITRDTLQVFYKGSLTAIHQRLLVPQYHPVVKPEHMPPEHRQYLHYNAEDFSRWADSVGHNTGKVVHMFLTGGREPEQGFKACTSMTKMAAKYGEKRLEEACSRLLLLSTPPSIRTLRTILQNNECRTAFSQSANADITEGNSEDLPSMPEHGIIRGAKYFRKGGASK